MVCPRCGKEMNTFMMSRFNTDIICEDCISAERKHPLYKAAVEAELEAVKRGDYNFPGIGWPGWATGGAGNAQT